MKYINKLLLIALVWLGASCALTDLELQENPNSVAPENADVNDLYNTVQLNTRSFVESVWYPTASMSRMISNTSAYNYKNAFSPQGFNGTWNIAYSNLFSDIQALITLAESRKLDVHAGSAKVMKAYVMMVLVDMFGDVPNTEALQGTNVISPKDDPGSQVYDAAGKLLDEAITQLTGTKAAAPKYDNFYGGSAAKWITLAKTLKLRAAVTTRLVNTGAAAAAKALVTENNLIDTEAEDFQFNYSNNRDNPNSRHPFYNDWYESGDGTYMSNYYMWLLRAEKQDDQGLSVVDPRIRFYFYRQTDKAATQAKEVYSCHFSTLPDASAQPAHYKTVDPRMPYCLCSEDGYWGRDHLNAEGTPPDGPLRTAWGLYPAGGQFDDNSFKFVQQKGTTGGLGAGIQPIMLASFADFLRAEAALTMGTGENPRALLESGIRKSMAKVIGFSKLVPATFARQIDNRGTLVSVEELYKPKQKDIDKYVNFVLAQYDAATDKLDVVMKEYLIALWGNGIEGYNMYRRTGKPNNMAPALEPNNSDFVLSFYLPDNHVNLNANVDQKATHTVRVFWDNGSAKVR